MNTISSRTVLGFSGLVLGGLLLTACDSSPDAAPATQPAPTTTATPAPVVGPGAKPAPAKPASSPVNLIGPNAYGKLKMGMTFGEVKAAGFIRSNEAPEGYGCGAYELYVDGKRDGMVHISADRGVEAIGPGGTETTPEGITIGSKLAKAKAAYPELDLEAVEHIGLARVSVPGNSTAVYRLSIKDGAVQTISLQLAEQKCYE